MKTIETFDGRSFLITDTEYQALTEKIETDQKFFRIKSADYVINKSDIKGFGEPQKIAMWGGYALDRGGTSFMRDGDRVYLEPQNYAEIEYKIHPKYGKGVEAAEETKQLTQSNDSFTRSLRN